MSARILKDRYARGHYKPSIDNMQVWFLISARQDDGYTNWNFPGTLLPVIMKAMV